MDHQGGRAGADRLFHALIDSIVDSAFPAIEALGERIETPKQYARSSPQHWPAYAQVHGVALREGEGAMTHPTRE